MPRQLRISIFSSLVFGANIPHALAIVSSSVPVLDCAQLADSVFSKSGFLLLVLIVFGGGSAFFLRARGRARAILLALILIAGVAGFILQIQGGFITGFMKFLFEAPQGLLDAAMQYGERCF